MIADPWFYAAAVPAILLVGVSKGGFGSGAGVFAVPLVALTVPGRAHVPLLSVYLLPQRLDKAVLVGTTVVFFAVINAVKLVPYAWLELFDGRNLTTSLALAPLAPIGIWVGFTLMRRVPEALFYRICYAILAVVGVRLLWEGIAAL